MGSFRLDLFTVCYDNRPKDWYNAAEDIFFPWAPGYKLSFVVKGYAEYEDVMYMNFRIFKGANKDGDTSKLPLIFESSDNEVNTNYEGFYYAQINTDLQLKQPLYADSIDEYTAEVEYDGETVGTQQFQIANLPPDINLLMKPVWLSYSMDEQVNDNGMQKADVRITFQCHPEHKFHLVIGAYLPCLKLGEKLFDGPGKRIPSTCFRTLNFYDSTTAKAELHFDIDMTELNTTRDVFHLILTIAGKTFLDIPATELTDGMNEEELAQYVVTDHMANDAADDMDEQLMPPAFRELLDFLDKRRVFDALRNTNSSDWKRHHLVLTGKKGTGKRTAAHLLGTKLQNAGMISSVTEVNAIELLDPTNGFSPKVEETLDANNSNLFIINNAEALTLKGSVGSLTGIEILANKLLKMPNITVVLLGKKGPMEELIKMCEPARELFYTFFEFSDVRPEVMTRLSMKWLQDRHFIVGKEAQEKLFLYFERAYSLRGMNFTNMYMAQQTIDDEILPRLVKRTITDNMKHDAPLPAGYLDVILPCDIPQAEERDPSVPLAKLESLIGLDNVKQSIINHTSLVRLNKIRADKGLYNRMPPMHMVFTGNPGTGKTTIAEYLGEIYRGIGALSSGHLVQTDRSKLVGQYIGDTEKNTLNAIQRASGGVLFIDEAYNLFVKSDDNRDFGMRVIETLLTYLSMEDTDMIVILAGYTNEMKRMIESNPGLKSRFPYIFHFEDYSPDQLMRIGRLVLQKEQYHLSEEAERLLSQYIIEEYNQKDEHFGNGRFITRLLKSHIIPAMSQRLNKFPTEELTDDVLCTIEAVDIPRHNGTLGKLQAIDETILKSALNELDQLIGVSQAKQALHNYVTTVRMERQAGALTASSQMLHWNFIGNTGMGKSTVAEVLGKLLQGLGLLKRGQCVTLNIEELTSHDMYDTLEKALKRAADGVLFMDMDSPRYRNQSTDSIRMWLVNKIKETKQQTAVVFAEVGESNEDVLRNLTLNGFASLYHSVIFSDFTAQELMQLLRRTLSEDYRLDIAPEADALLANHIETTHRNATRNAPANARTIQMMAQTVAQSARLRIAAHPDAANEVTTDDLQDMEHISDSRGSRIGF